MKVRVSRKWSRKTIEINVIKDGIQIDMPLEDFLQALCAETQFRWTRAGQLSEILAAAERVVLAMKMETAKQPLFGGKDG